MNTQSKTPVWKIHELEYELDLEDANMMERYELAFVAMQEDEKMLPKNGAASQIIKPYCQMYYRLFDNLFGEGSGSQILRGRYNARECDEVYESFLSFISEYSSAVKERRNSMVERFQGNRETRRAAQRKKKQ